MGRMRKITAVQGKRCLNRFAMWGIAAVGAAGLAVRSSAWPSALLIRAVFAKGARATVQEMTQFPPPDAGVIRPRMVKRPNPRSRGIDLYLPANPTGPLPTVVWIHGGAWISGSRKDIAPYLRMLAARGYAAVGLDYSVAPGKRYPTAISELNEDLRYLTSIAEQLGIDPGRMVLAGDSAGAQLASQLATMASNPAYARQVGIEPGIAADQLSGVILYCGVYDLDALSMATGLVGWGFKTALWAYAGERDWSGTPAARDMSTLRHVNRNFPPAFISGGNGDGLTKAQSMALADRLTELQVPVTKLFWDTGHEPALPHEYQFHLRFPEAHQAFAETITFIEGVVMPRPNTVRRRSTVPQVGLEPTL